jgi:glycosyltransferase involved in cell wall biosynthesis
MNGADVVLRCAQFWRKPLICRMGYMWSEFVNYENGSVEKVKQLENNLFRSADRIIVTTNEMRENILERIPDSKAKTSVVPNYVETDRFTLNTDMLKEFDILFVGRLSPQKNVSALLTALSDLDIKAIIIGNGELRDELQSQFGDLNGKVSWQRNIPNSKLPAMMNRSRIFILPSHYEGHPKTLIEAMSCGMSVIGADSPGIREIIRHGENGWLCGTDVESIGKAIRKLLKDPALAQRFGDNARKFVLQNYALEDIVEKELQIIKDVAIT